MGTVFRGYDPVLERPVAINSLKRALPQDRAEGDMLERVDRQARAAASLDHPNVVTMNGYGEGGPRSPVQRHGVDRKARTCGTFLSTNRAPDWLGCCQGSPLIDSIPTMS